MTESERVCSGAADATPGSTCHPKGGKSGKGYNGVLRIRELPAEGVSQIPIKGGEARRLGERETAYGNWAPRQGRGEPSQRTLPDAQRLEYFLDYVSIP